MMLVTCHSINKQGLKVIATLLRLPAFLCLFLPLTSFAMVWETQNQWNEDYEIQYREWMKNNIHREIYKKDGPVGKVKTDCADAVLGARIIFAYQNKLPFTIANPTGNRIGSYPALHNELNKWDYIADEKKRVAKFIEYIGDSVGTDFLARYATYSVKPEAITSGDTYVYKSGGTRHSYIIKDIHLNGNQYLFWSTTPKIVRKLSKSLAIPGKGFDTPPWGYRRFRWPEHMGASESLIAEEMGRSKEQYAMARKHGFSKVLKQIRRVLRVKDEELGEMLKRMMANTCSALEDRVEIVNLALSFKNQIGRCMRESEFHNYSTPSRDKKLFEQIKEIMDIWKEAFDNDEDQGIDGDFRKALHYLAGTNEGDRWFRSRNDEDRVHLRKFCKVELPHQALGTFDLYDFYRLKKKKDISSNPNDNIFRRWGLKEGRRSRCKKY